MTTTPPRTTSALTIFLLIAGPSLLVLAAIILITHLENQAILDCISAGHTPSECHAVINN